MAHTGKPQIPRLQVQFDAKVMIGISMRVMLAVIAVGFCGCHQATAPESGRLTAEPRPQPAIISRVAPKTNAPGKLQADIKTSTAPIVSIATTPGVSETDPTMLGNQARSAATATASSDIVWSNGVWRWKEDSLAWNCVTNAMACSNGLKGAFSNMFTAFSPTDRRNPNFWFRRFKGWPALSVWNNGNTNLWPTNGVHTSRTGVTYQGGGVLVTPEHVLTAGHMGFASNTWLAFMDMNDNVVFRQVKDYFYLPYVSPPTRNNVSTNMPSPPWSEYYIGLLDRPVPESIGFARIIPTNWWAWFDAPFRNTGPANPEHPVPLYLWNCQHRTPVLQDLTYLQCVSGVRHLYFNELTLTNWKDHNVEAGGDSGSPWFFVLDGELCLARINRSNVSFLGGKSLSDPAYQQACINAAMRELSLRNGHTNIYTLTVKDLSRFPQYGQNYDCPP